MSIISNIGLPKISVIFKEAANTAPKRFVQSKVALAIVDHDSSLTDYVKEIKSVDELTITPLTISQETINFIKRTFIGAYGRTPSLVYVSISSDINAALDNLKKYDFDWIAAIEFGSLSDEEDTAAESSIGSTLVSWATQMRSLGKSYKAVVASSDMTDSDGDEDAYVRLDAEEITLTDDTVIEESEYTSRIAGLLASLPLSQSCTYYILDDVKNVMFKTKAEIESGVNSGNFCLINDGGVVRIARAIMSDKSKVKYAAIKDKIETDVKTAIKDSFIGKYAATYNNKCLLIAALKNYFDKLAKLEIIGDDVSIGIDIEAQESYLKSLGIDTSSMTEQEIKAADTGDEVFILITLKVLDAMENFKIVINNN